LTGRDNIFLNGAILGMKGKEIRSKYEEIVAFAEVEKFIDTPIKRYSSGMYLRLAFAVAAHLEPEILLVDEVLAVGDVAFQKRCLNKMEDVGREGRTVLFVSHNMPAIRTLCSRAIVLHQGVIRYEGETIKAVQYYLGENSALNSQKVWIGEDRPGNQTFKLNSIKLKNAVGEEVSAINISEEAFIEIEYELIEDGRAQFSLVLFDADGYCIFGSMSNTEPNFYGKPMPAGNYRSSCFIYGNLLNAGRFHVAITGGSAYWTEGFNIDRVISFDAIDDGVLKGDYYGVSGGVIKPKLKWETVPL
jgi:lipopolysaccharide transport system ATP-binding protein